MNGTLLIRNVDLSLLDDQRLELRKLSPETIGKWFTEEQQDALEGILNMLDDWSDEQSNLSVNIPKTS